MSEVLAEVRLLSVEIQYSPGPLKKHYLASRDFLWGKFLPRTLFRSWILETHRVLAQSP